MSFDLTNKNIQDTFQNLLQKTGSDGRLHDLVGNQVNDITLTNVSASGHISASKFVGDGSELTGVSGFATALSNDTTSILNSVFKTPRELPVGTGVSVTIESDAASGAVTFERPVDEKIEYQSDAGSGAVTFEQPMTVEEHLDRRDS